MKTVAIQKNLETLIEPLQEKGFKVVFADQANEPLYAYIYYEDSIASGSNFNLQFNTHFSSGYNDNAGVLLINARSKSNEDIIAILEHRTYSPLF